VKVTAGMQHQISLCLCTHGETSSVYSRDANVLLLEEALEEGKGEEEQKKKREGVRKEKKERVGEKRGEEGRSWK